MNTGFTENIVVIDEWAVNEQRYRLVDVGAGPKRLQTINPDTNDTDWRQERGCYIHDVLCRRIEYLAHKQRISKMEKYRNRITGEIIEAVCWLSNGDHPEDNCREVTDVDLSTYQSEGKVVRYYRHPKVDGKTKCPLCGYSMDSHGWLDDLTLGCNDVVCPGDYIIPKEEHVKGHVVIHKDIFYKLYGAVRDNKPSNPGTTS